jgi:hypothetical protein
MPWSPSKIGLAERHCNKALDHADAGTPYKRSIFGAGTAAHHVLQAVGEHENREQRPLERHEYEAVAADVLRRLVSEGRTYEGHKEPPINAASAAQGMDLALEYLDFYPLPSGAEFERGLAVDADWQPVDDWHGRWFGCIVDAIYETEDFATEARAVVVVDYKTSWQAGRDELETLQRKAQACCAIAHHPDVDEVWLEIHNLRTQAIHRKTVPVDSPVIARWRLEVQTVIGALDNGPRIATPGAGCHGCPYLLACEEALDYFERSDVIFEHGGTVERARAFAVAGAMVGKLRGEIKRNAESEPIDIGDSLVGYVKQERRKPVPDAGRLLWDKWQSRNGTVDGLMKAMNIGKSQIEATAKVLWPDKGQIETRRRFVDSITEPDNRAVFKAVKKPKEAR